MKQLLLHGPAIKASRIKLQQLKDKFHQDDIVVFDSLANIGQVMANLMEIPMFSQDRLIIWENPPEDFSYQQLLTTNCQLILWFDHQVDTKKWPGYEVMVFEESREASVFPFLDCLANKDKKALTEIKKLKDSGFDTYYFLTMVFYLLRNLVITPKNAPQFVKDKLQRQRKNFSQEEITKLYKDILEIDFKIKSGLLEKDQAEFLLISRFINY